MQALCCEAKIVSPSQRLAHHITMADVNYYAADNHEAASKFIDQKVFGLNIRQRIGSTAFEAEYGLWTSSG
jgi:hypothetical protein